MQERSLNIKTTDAIFCNAILKFFKTVRLEILHAKSRNNKTHKALVCELKKTRSVCKLCFMLMHVFGRISVGWRNLTFDILSYRAVLALNFAEKAPLILVSYNYYV